MNQDSNKRPVIGITCGEVHNKIEPWSPVTFGQSRTYIDSIIAAGGVPLLLPLTDDPLLLQTYSDIIDGLLLAGGNDLSPELCGQPVPADQEYSALRDACELALLRQALDQRKPILGICRGMQLLNAQYGGTLYQDIAAQVPGSLDHNASTKLKTLVDVSHTLRLQPDSKLAGILGRQPIGANAHHHQAIDQLGDAITATAWASDEIIEAIELADYPYAIGLQAHPESLTVIEPRWAKLFASFVAAA
jgi:putative glutamine amidotransferase